jgi:heavy metal translocating P-type ATPase
MTTTTLPAAEFPEIELAVTGMTCAACAARVQKHLGKIDGVSAVVNLATEKATVRRTAPVPVAALIAQVAKAGYGAALVEDAAPETGDRVRDLWRRLIVALLFGVPLADLSITLVLVPSLRFVGWQWVLLAMTLPVVTWSAWPFHRRAFVAARHGGSSMDTLVSLGVITAAAWSMFTVFHDSADRGGGQAWGLIFQPAGSVYLDVAAGVTIFVLAGRLLEAKARRAAGDALRALAQVGAKQATVLRADGTEERTTAASLRVGERFVVRPGETIATDGVVADGSSAVDMSAMTGESAPVATAVGDPVIGGTVAVAGRLVVEATRVGADTQLAQLVALVERAQTEKAGVQRVADRISSVFVPVVIGLAILTGLGWALAGAPAEQAISTGLAVLIIACPCALGLATPTALLAASGRGAQLGVFIKGHQALESARAIDTVVLDKTGTVTTGRMTVLDRWTADGVDRDQLLGDVGAVENAAEHAIGRVIAAYALRQLGRLPRADEFKALPGLGAQGWVDGRPILVGSPRLLAQNGYRGPAELAALREVWERKGATVVLVGTGGVVTAGFALADTVKSSAAGAVAALREMGLRTVLLTGDNQSSARTVAAAVGVDEVIAEVLPADKAATIERLQAEGRVVAMVGDGVNDAPALVRADLGMAVVTGTDVALGAADVILVRDDLSVVPTAVALARRTLTTIRGNLIWAFGYNLLAVPIAAAGLLNPLISSGAMALSSLLVVSNSLRLRGFGEVRR